jgi:hypothetical protein
MKRQVLFLGFLFLFPKVSPVHAIVFPQATYVPFDRLIANTTALIKDHPNDPQGYYTLARMHYFTFVNRAAFVPVHATRFWTSFPDDVPLKNVAADWQVPASGPFYDLCFQQATRLVLKAWGYTTTSDVPAERQSEFWDAVNAKDVELRKQGWHPEYLDTTRVLAHAATAVDNFERALDLDPENGLFYLGLASLYEQYSSYTAAGHITSHPRQLACVTLPKIRVLYYLAYRFAVEKDRRQKYMPTWGPREFVSHEAGTAYLRLATKEPVIADTNAIAEIKADLAKSEKLPMGDITPIIFSTREHGSALELLDSDTHVTFDLDGLGRNLQWPWLKPSTGLLVWDPFNKGEITSGRQLFGTATWWLLFPSGYAALDALDDNRDGSLSGSELRGIGVWFDKNANGRSDPGEVQPVADFGVRAIRTRATGSDHGMPMNPQGIVLKDGTMVPTYDWIVAPIASNPAQHRRTSELKE